MTTVIVTLLTLMAIAAAEIWWLFWFTRSRRPKGILEGFAYDWEQSLRELTLNINEKLLPAFAQFTAWITDHGHEIVRAAESMQDVQE